VKKCLVCNASHRNPILELKCLGKRISDLDSPRVFSIIANGNYKHSNSVEKEIELLKQRRDERINKIKAS